MVWFTKRNFIYTSLIHCIQGFYTGLPAAWAIIFISQLYLAALYVEIVLSIAAGSPVSLLVIRGCLQWDLNWTDQFGLCLINYDITIRVQSRLREAAASARPGTDLFISMQPHASGIPFQCSRLRSPSERLWSHKQQSPVAGLYSVLIERPIVLD